MGWLSFCEVAVIVTSPACEALPEPRFGEADMVVAFVFAVGGRSSEARDMAAPEVGGSLPVSSKRWIRDLRSSNSSQTVEGAAVDVVELVPS